MQEIQAHFVELAYKSEKSIAQIAKEAGVAESTVRRFLRGDDISVNSLGKIAAAVGGTTVDLDGLIPDKTAVAVEIVKHEVKQEIEQEFKPHSEQCANACPARKAMNETISQISELYEKRLEERKVLYEERFTAEEKLYERALEEKNEQLAHKDTEIAAVKAEAEVRIARFRLATYILLGLLVAAVVFYFYLIFVDFPNPTWGIFQYSTSYWDNIIPQTFRM